MTAHNDDDAIVQTHHLFWLGNPNCDKVHVRCSSIFLFKAAYSVKSSMMYGLTAGNALTAVVAAGIAQDISPITVPTELEGAVDLQRDVVKQVLSLAVPGQKIQAV